MIVDRPRPRAVLRPGHDLLLAVSLFLIVAASLAALRPLQGVHWDAPIYLYQAKRFAETPLVHSYATHAEHIAGQVTGIYPLPAGEAYPEAYWRFTRLGHIAILGSIVGFFRDPQVAVLAATQIYGFLLALGTILAIVLVHTLLRLYAGPGGNEVRPRRVAALWGLAFGLSSVYAYMAGNLVAEVPALFTIAAGILLLSLALLHNRPIYAVASGLLAFSTFVVKADAVWHFVAIWLAILLAPPPTMSRVRISALLCWACGAAAAAYGLHARLFYPLGSPWVMHAFQQQVLEALPPGGSTRASLLIAGGPLWLGLPLSLGLLVREPLARFGWIWLGICLFPPLVLAASQETQTRMFVTLALPLMLLATVGVADWVGGRGSVQRVKRMGLIALTVTVLAAILISHQATYERLRQVPGGWRLQYLRAFVAPPKFEVHTYPVSEAAEIARWLYAEFDHAVLVVAPDINQEVLNLIRFFGPAYPPTADLAKVPDPTNLLSCRKERPTPEEPMAYRAGSPESCCAESRNGPILHLRRATGASDQSRLPRFRAGVYEVVDYCTAVGN